MVSQGVPDLFENPVFGRSNAARRPLTASPSPTVTRIRGQARDGAPREQSGLRRVALERETEAGTQRRLLVAAPGPGAAGGARVDAPAFRVRLAVPPVLIPSFPPGRAAVRDHASRSINPTQETEP